MASSSVAYIELEGSKVAIIGLEAVFGLLDTEELTALFAEAENNSDLQVVYVHFGDEYQPLHTKTQETLARTFVSLGADAVVGHHPHVVQDVELISGVPVFYSLGNYVFDQYWDDSVTTGLTVLMRIKDKRPVFELIPVATERGVPYVPNEAVSRELLESVARRSQEMLRSDIVRGVVSGELR
jgi:poly-gamma-glutamate synthesis protein (capsule biosynthesis protein)